MFTQENNNIEQMEKLIQFASKSETTTQLQSFWYNRYSEMYKNKLFVISENTITNVLQADQVLKPITPSASIILSSHLVYNDITKLYEIDESKLQSSLEVLVRLLDAIIDAVNFSNDAKYLVKEYRKVGISILDFESFLQSNSLNINDKVDYVGSLISNGVYRASESLAEEKGVCQGWESINKNIKNKSFEYWFNIDTGEIKSGIEIASEYSDETIVQSKFEIVPRRNSHILLFSATGEWLKWTDRDKLVNVEAAKPVAQEEFAANQDAVSDEKVAFEDDKILEIEKNNNLIESKIKDLEELIVSKSNSTGSISENIVNENIIDVNFDNKEILEVDKMPSPDMISLDELMGSLDNSTNTATEAKDNEVKGDIFNPVDVLDKIKNPNSNTETTTNEEAKDKKNNVFSLAKLFNPFSQDKNSKYEEKAEEKADDKSEDKNANQEFSEKLTNDIVIENEVLPVDEQIIEVAPPIIEASNDANHAAFEVETKSELAIEPVVLPEILPTSAAEITPQTHSNIEQEFALGELVKIVDKDDEKYGKYMQVVDLIDQDDAVYLVLIDGISDNGTDEHKQLTYTINQNKVEPASIESVLMQLNVNNNGNHNIDETKQGENVKENEIENINEQSAVVAESEPIEETNYIKVLLLNENNEVLLVSENGEKYLPTIKSSALNGYPTPELAIIDILFINYNISGIENLSEGGVYIGNEDHHNILPFYGFINARNSNVISHGISFEDIMHAKQGVDDLRNLLENIEDSNNKAIEKISTINQEIEATNQGENLEQENINNNNINNNMNEENINDQNMQYNNFEELAEENIMKEVNIGSIDSNYANNYHSATGNINASAVEAVKSAENTANFAQPEYTVNKTSQSGYINTGLDQNQYNKVQSITQFPQNSMLQKTPVQNNNVNTINNTTTNLNMLYQSTSSVASYSKFSVVLKQIISTAEFGNIILYIHYDVTGPKVITVELPQLINDSVLQVLRTYLNLINASLIRGSELASTVSLIQDQLELAGETGPISILIGIILNAVNALPKQVQELSTARIIKLDSATAKEVVKTGIDPLKALAEKYLVSDK